MSQNQSEHIRDLAIKRHELDAQDFQARYLLQNDRFENAFLYGRAFIREEIDAVLAELPKGAKVLDLGCGTGHLSAYVRDKGFEVVGVEPAEAMLENARRNFPDIRFEWGIGSKIPFSDGAFDLVFAIEVLRYLDQTEVEKTYREVSRVLRPGGVFLVTHVNSFATDFFRPFYHLKGIFHRMQHGFYQNCYFTSASKERRMATENGFSKAETFGRMAASIRIFYKFGRPVGEAYARVVEVFSPKQNHRGAWQSLTGHLFVKAVK